MSRYSFLISSYEFTDETPQIAEKQLIITMDKAKKNQSFKDTKISDSVFSADISKREEISRW